MRTLTILQNSNPSPEDLKFAQEEGFILERNAQTGEAEWIWSPSLGRRIVEIFHFLLTFEDPWERFRGPQLVYGRDYI